MKNLINILIVIAYLDYYYSNAIYSCKSPTTEQNVDWFVVYKLPKLPEHDNPLIAEGKAYLYADGISYGWTLLNHGIDDNESAIGRTFVQKISDNEEEEEEEEEEDLFFTYNDQCPGEVYNSNSNSKRGHMKGMVLFDQNRGFWLIHTILNFPMDRGEYKYPPNAIAKGQSFLCISMATPIFENQIAHLLHFSGAYRCSGNLPHWIENNPHVRGIVQRQPYQFAYGENAFTIKREHFTINNDHAFVAFFKYNGYNRRDLYSHVGEALGISDFLVQSYITNWPMYGCQNCLHYEQHPYKVHNVTKICLENFHIEFDTFFPGGPDHSKWAVSRRGYAWVCIGDLNRQKSQLERGGGAICFNNGVIANLFRQAFCGWQHWCSKH